MVKFATALASPGVILSAVWIYAVVSGRVKLPCSVACSCGAVTQLYQCLFAAVLQVTLHIIEDEVTCDGITIICKVISAVQCNL